MRACPTSALQPAVVEAGLVHLPGHHRGMGGHPPTRRENAFGGVHANDVLGRGLDPPQDHRLARGTEALGLVVSLCEALQHNEIRYCHWKSNDKVGDGLAGRADIDVLIDRINQPPGK